MSKPKLPRQLWQQIEQCGAIHLPADPPDDVGGWVLAVHHGSTSKPTDEVTEFLFVEHGAASASLQYCLEYIAESKDAELLSAGIFRSEFYFNCSFCGKKRREVGPLSYGLREASI